MLRRLRWTTLLTGLWAAGVLTLGSGHQLQAGKPSGSTVPGYTLTNLGGLVAYDTFLVTGARGLSNPDANGVVLVDTKLADWGQPGRMLSVYTEVPPLQGRRLDRLPEWSRRAHGRLLGQHVDQLAGITGPPPGVTAVMARLDRLNHPTGPGLAPVLGR